MSRSLFLGVDGGGTKTDFVLLDNEGRIVAACSGASAYHLQVGLDGLRDVLATGLAALFAQAAIDESAVSYAFFGLPAYGEDSAIEPVLDALPRPLLGHARYRCGNDMLCAWAGSLGGEDGINIVAGTGSIAYGERRGNTARVGGWGELLGDEGSAYWLALRGLNAFTRMSDGRAPKGPLYAIFRTKFGLSADLDLCAKVMDCHNRDRIAALSPLVARAAEEGDATAIQIFNDAARELAAMIEAVRQALQFQQAQPVAVSYSGGVFGVGALLLAPLRNELERLSASYAMRVPLAAPGIGAAIYAAKLAGRPFSLAALQHAKEIHWQAVHLAAADNANNQQ